MSEPHPGPGRWLFYLFIFTAALSLPNHGGGQAGDTPPAFSAERTAPGQWQLTWESVPGTQYKLQRSIDLDDWDDVATLVADSAETTATDAGVGTAKRTFWRVLAGDAGSDLSAPVVSIISVRQIDDGGSAALELKVRAEDNVGVVAVAYTEGGGFLGAATTGDALTWSRIVPFDPQSGETREFQAQASDAAGNVGFSPIYIFDPELISQPIQPLDPDGGIDSGGIVGMNPDGSLTPFAYKPPQSGGGGGAGSASGLIFYFPQGGRLVEIDGQNYIEYAEVAASFGDGAALAFAQPDLGGADKALGDPLPIPDGAFAAAFSSPRLLSMEIADQASVARALGIDPAAGVPMVLFDRFPLRWMAGTLTDTGILGGCFRPDASAFGLPLPPESAIFPEQELRFENARAVTLPFSGQFSLPLAGGAGEAVATIPATAPLQITLCADGTVSASGAAELAMPNGLRFRFSFSFDDPVYELSLGFGAEDSPLAGGLLGALPPDPAALLPGGGAPPAEIDAALDRLAAFGDSVARLNAIAAQEAGFRGASGNAAPEAKSSPEWPGAPNLGAQALALLGEGSAAASLPAGFFDQIGAALGKIGGGALASKDPASIAANLQLAYALRQQVAAGTLTSTPNGDAALADSAERAFRAALRALGDPAESGGLPTAQAVADAMCALQANSEFPAARLGDLVAAWEPVADAIAARRIAELGIVAGESDPNNNPAVAAMAAGEAAENLRQLFALRRKLDLLGAGASLGAPFAEAFGQLGARANAALRTGFQEAQAAGDPDAMIFAARGLAQLAQLKAGNPFPPVAGWDAFPDAAELGSFLDAWIAAQAAAGSGASAARLGIAFAAAGEVLDAIGDGNYSPSDPAAASALFGDLDQALGQASAVANLPSVESASELADLILAGTAHARMGRHLGVAPLEDWASVRLPRLAGRLNEIAAGRRDGAVLGRAAAQLLEDARRIDAAQHGAAKRDVLAQIAALAGGQAQIAQALWQAGAPDRDAAPLGGLELVDGFTVESAAGSFRYDARSGEVEGSVQGELAMPKFNATLTIQNASFSTDGAFDLNAFGSISLPFDDPIATISIPALRPLHVSWDRRDGFRLDSAAEIAFDNGLFFKGAIRYQPPIYEIELEAGDLEFDLVKDLATSIPSFPAAASFVQDGEYDLDELQLWHNFYGGLLSSYSSVQLASDNDPSLIEGDAFYTGNGGASSSSALRSFGALAALDSLYSAPAPLGAKNGGLPAVDEDLHRKALDAIETRLNEMIPALDGAIADLSGLKNKAANQKALGDLQIGPWTGGIGEALSLNIDPGFNVQGTAAATPGESTARGLRAFVPGLNEIRGWNHVRNGTPGVAGDFAIFWNVSGDTILDPALTRNIAVDFGRSDGREGAVIDWAREPVHDFIPPGSRGAGVLATEVMGDYIAGHGMDAENSAKDKVGVRITGLGAGFYYVMPCVANSTLADDGYRLWAGTSSDIDSPAMIEGFLTGVGRAVWSAGDNYALLPVTAAANDSLVVACQSEAQKPGRINAIQIAPAAPLEIDTVVDPTSIALGDPVRFRLTAAHVTRVAVESGGQVLKEFTNLIPLSASNFEFRADFELLPVPGETLEIIYENANQRLTRPVTLDQSELKRVMREAGEDIGQSKDDIEASAEQLKTLCAKENLPPDIVERCAALTSKMIEATEKVGQGLADLADAAKDNPEFLRSDDSVEELAKDILDNSALAGSLGADDAALAKVTEVIDAALDQREKDFGVKEDGSFNVGKIESKTVAESEDLLDDYLDRVGQAAALGSERPINNELLARHGDNILKQVLDRVLDKETGDVTFPDDLVEAASLLNGLGKAIPFQGLAEFEGKTVLDFNTFGQLNRYKDVFFIPQLKKRIDEGGTRSPRRWEERFVILRGLVTYEDSRGTNTFTETSDLRPDFVAYAAEIYAQIAEEAPQQGLMTKRENAFLLEAMKEERIANARGPRLPRLTAALDLLDAALQRNWTAADLRRAPERIYELLEISRIAEDQFTAVPPAVDKAALSAKAAALASKVRDTSLALGNSHYLNLFNDAIFAARRAIELEQLKLPDDAPNQPLLAKKKGEKGQPDERDPFFDVLGAAAAESLSGSEQLALSGGSFLDTFNPFEFTLPGGGQIRRVYGRLFYNAETGFLEGSFGGTFAIPDSNFLLDLEEATIANDGSFAISMRTEGEFGIGDTGRIAFDVPTLQASSGPGGPFVFNGAGTIGYTDDGGVTRSFDVGVDYSSGTGLLRVDGQSDNLNLILAQDVALLAAQVGVDFSTSHPEGALTVSGKLGLVAREKPLPEDRPLTEEDFWLVLDINPATFAFTAEDFTAELTGGTLTLPPDIFSELGDDTPATIALDGTLCLRLDFDEGLFFCGEEGDPYTLTADNIAFAIPGLDDFVVEVENATLELFGDQFPVLRNLDASLHVPLPGTDASDPAKDREELVTVEAVDWKLDGFPSEASIALATNLRVVDFDGFDVDLLGGNSELPECQTRLSFTSQEVGGALETEFTLVGGVRAFMDGDLLYDSDTGDRFAITTCGSLTWSPGSVPQFSIDVLELAGRFRIGGESGVGITGVEEGELATIRIIGVENIFMQTPQTPFKIVVDGAMDVANFVKFGLVDTAFIWEGELLPRFEPGGFQAELGDQSVELAGEFLPMYVNKAGIRFADGSLPLLPAEGEVGLFDYTNLTFIISGAINLPNKQAIDSGSPGISGQVEDLEVTLAPNGSGGFLPDFNLNGFGMQIQNLELGPIGAITGGIYVGNLNYPEELYFAGVVGGRVNDIGAEVLIALRRDGIIGACFSLSAGPAGIPLDGGSLGGILLTGGEGGLHFNNGFADPCDFSSYVQLETDPADGQMKPVDDPDNPTTFPATDDKAIAAGQLWAKPFGWDQLAAANKKKKLADAVDAAEERLAVVRDAGGEVRVENAAEIDAEAKDLTINCIEGTFPPSTINPLCEFHSGAEVAGGPYEGRVIFKGTELDEAELNQLGFTRASVPPGNTQEKIDWAVEKVTQPGRDIAANLINAIPGGTDQNAAAFYTQKVNELADMMEDAARNVIGAAFEEATGIDPNTDFYDVVLEVGEAGIPCFDITLRLSGTFSHTAISSVLSGTVGATVSTTGTSVLDGSINLIGIPVANGTFAFSLTNSQGDIDPSFGALARVGLGPLELGEMSAAIGCDGCYVAVMDAFTVMLADGANTFSPELNEFFVALMDVALPEGAPRDPGIGAGAHFANLPSDSQRLAFVSSVFNIVNIIAAGQSSPVAGTISPQTFSELMGHFRAFLSTVLSNVNPTICFSGQVGPKLFGFPLTGGAGNLVGAGFLYSRIHDNALGEDFQEIVATMDFSPSYMLAAAALGSAAYVVPATDQASLSYSYRIPAFTPEVVGQALDDPAAFAADQFQTMVEDAVVSFGYQFQPLGLRLGNGQGRIIMPRLASHPTRPGVNWALPAGDAVATRMELILAALNKGRLQDPTWKGSAGELDELFWGEANEGENGYEPTEGSCEYLVDVVRDRLDQGQMEALSFAGDYFPHGGMIGGAEISLPNFIAELPPPNVVEIFNVPSDLNTAQAWLANAQDIFANYLTATTCVGQMAFYLPAPNPVQLPPLEPGGDPVPFDFENASLADLQTAITQLDFDALANRSLPAGIYPTDQILLSGWLDVPILGMPVAQGFMEFDNARQCFVAHAEIPDGTWLSDFASGTLDIEIKNPRYLDGGSSDESFADKLNARLAALQSLDPADVQANAEGIVGDTVNSLRDYLPRGSFEAAASVQVPPELEGVFNVSASTGLKLFGFSLAYEPGYLPADDTPYAIARRRGGVGLMGNFELGYFPPSGQPIEISVPNASFAITPDANTALFPALAGTLRDVEVNVPFLPELTGGELTFNSSPADGETYIAVEGHLTPFGFRLPGARDDLLAFNSIDPRGTIGGRLQIYRDDSLPGNNGARLIVDPMSASLPALGQDIAITVFGDEPKPGSFTEFSFSTAAGEPWSASICLTSARDPEDPPTFEICDPFDPQGPCLLTFTPNDRVCGTITGVGLDSFAIELQIPAGFAATAFPGQETEASAIFGGTGFFTFYLDSTGRMYADFDQQDGIDLPGALTAGARLEFGYNPAGDAPDVRAVPGTSVNFGSVDLGESAAATVTVINDGTSAASVGFNASPNSDYTLAGGGFQLGPGESQSIDVIFHPSAAGARNGSLQVLSNDPDSPSIPINLVGSGVAVPKYFQSLETIRFADTVVGGEGKATVLVGNSGTAPLTLVNVSSSGAPFSVSPAGGAIIPPGDSRLLTVTFSPTALQSYAESITVQTAGQGTHHVSLFGAGTQSRWLTLLDAQTAGSASDLNSIRMIDRRRGWVAGDNGTLLETQNGGRSWIPHEITNFDLNDIALRFRLFDNEVLAELHFEEPAGATSFQDDSGHGRHGSTSGSAAPAAGYAYGHFGSGLRFDGSNDWVDFTAFPVPDSFSISLWVNPHSTANGQVFVGKNTASGDNELLFGFYAGGYHVNFDGQQATQGTPATGWQHLVLTALYLSGSDETRVRIYRDGTQIFDFNFSGRLPANHGSSRPWTLGNEWDGGSRSDFLDGDIDEVYFFAGEINSGERNYLRGETASLRMLLAGDSGMVFESYTGGSNWAQLADNNVLGWRSRFGRFDDINWNAVTMDSSTKVILGGEKNGGDRIVMLEDFYDGDEFDEVEFDISAGSGANEPIHALDELGGVFAAAESGYLLEGDPPDFTWYRHGNATAGVPLYDLATFYPIGAEDYVAVGQGGAIMRADNTVPLPVNHGLTTEDLRGVTYESGLNPELHVVGDNGTYMTSTNNGANWQLVDDGLEGNMRAIDVDRGTLTTTYEAWAVGEDHAISYRPRTAPSGPFLTFHPGELDFGFLILGNSRTLPLEIANRGGADLQIDDLRITGTGFSLVLGDVERIPPGGRATLQVRYRPTAASAYDAGALTIEAGGEEWSASLVGRASERDWQAVAVGVDGEVLDVESRSGGRVYVLVDTPAETFFYRSQDGGLNYTRINLPLPDLRLTGMDWGTSNGSRGYLCGYQTDGMGNFKRNVALHSANSGSTWNDITPAQILTGAVPAMVDISVNPSSSGRIIATTANTAGGGTPDVWYSDNIGASWQTKTNRPSSDFQGEVTGIVAHSSNQNLSLVLASDGSTLFSRYWQNNYSLETVNKALEFNPAQHIRAFSFYDDPLQNFIPDFGWIVGDQGLFWRFDPNTPLGAKWYPAPNAEVFGTTDLRGVSFYDADHGWVVGESRIFKSADGGRSWDLHFDAGLSAQINDVHTQSATVAYTGGSLETRAVVWRYRAAPAVNAGILAANDLEFFNPASPGGSATRNVVLQNIGNAPLAIHQIAVESPDAVARFRLPGGVPTSINAGESVVLPIRFEAAPEPFTPADLDAEVFLRFEQQPGATTYYDCSRHARHGNAPPDPADQAFIQQGEGARDWHLDFRGNDYAEISGIDALPGDYSFSLWVNPRSTSGQRAFFGKHSAGGGNLILCGLYGAGYYFNVREQTFSAGTRRTGWQHIAVVCRNLGTTTQVTFYQDGDPLWETTLNAVAGSIPGKPWTLGADWDSATNRNDHLTGSIDDFAIFQRALSESEIQRLAAKSPLAGDHQATLAINSGSEDGRREIGLRARVADERRLVTFQTVPAGLPVTVDGLEYASPVSFSVGSTARSEREWCEGSAHTVSVPDAESIAADGGNTLEYRFGGWDAAPGREIIVDASSAQQTYVATYVVGEAVAPPAPIIAPAAAKKKPGGGGEKAGLNIAQALAGTGQGPFLRLTEGSLTIPNLGTGFAIEGEMFLSLHRLYASLTSAAIAFPDAPGDKFIEVGQSDWLLDFEAGGDVTLKAHPPSLALLGFDVVPDGQVCFEAQPGSSHYALAFTLENDFKPLPNLLEFKAGGVRLEYDGALSLDLGGGIRVLRLPDQSWAIDETVDIALATPAFELSLDGVLGLLAPDSLVEIGPFEVAWGDVRIGRSGSDFTLRANDVMLSVYGSDVVEVDAEVGASGAFEFEADLGAGDSVDLLSGGRFSVKRRSAAESGIVLGLKPGLVPELKLHLPDLVLHSTAPGFPAAGLNIPGIEFDTGGDFDTGKVSLPSFSFDGIALSKPATGVKADNFIQLSRQSGDIRFDIAAEIVFLPGCPLHDISFGIDGTNVNGSMRGQFCVLPHPVSLTYDSASNCQFESDVLGFCIKFGSGCASWEPGACDE